MNLTHIDLSQIRRPCCPVTGHCLASFHSSSEIVRFRQVEGHRWVMEVCDEKVRSLNKLSELWDTFFLDTKIQGILDAIEVFASKPEVSILLELHTDSESLLLVKFLENGENVLYLSDPWFDQFAHAPDEEE